MYVGFTIPHAYRSGTDLLSKSVLKDQRVINLLARSVVDAPNDTYIAGQSDFMDGTACDVLYIPRSAASTLPPIVFEIQRVVDDKFMLRAVRYATIVGQVHHRIPIIVVLCVESVVNTVFNKFNAPCDYPFAKEAHCDFWAQRCILLSEATLRGHIAEDMHPLAALGHFISSESPSTLTIEYGSSNETIRLFYKVAQENLEVICGQQNGLRQGLQHLCQNLESQLQKVKQSIMDGATTKALKYTEDGFEYLTRQKRKYSETRETTPIEDSPPLKHLTKKDSTSDAHDELLQYTENFRNQRTGRMDWIGCYNQAIRDNFTMITAYKDAETLRVVCDKYRKKASGRK
ncbi:hypothetical protein RO3G_05785 [Lichtheimia corymbifera JMRC:FSU:9682]|uniref:Uncharacterized protein n=1 Tax=Lichtheimia corymbifera JMRC:FSU:9682 TaxID=1263082 RepID=A0A068SE31_9FUNG|nr:hypothetical protein RO3G_05785 [Lichtheimia corymbifera JMRC:FSU:9682]